MVGKKALNKKQYYSFGLKNSFPLIGMKDFLKNIWDNGRKWFPLARKSVSTTRISSVFKNWFPLMAISTGRKKLSNKVTVSIRERNPSPIAGMKDSFKNTFH